MRPAGFRAGFFVAPAMDFDSVRQDPKRKGQRIVHPPDMGAEDVVTDLPPPEITIGIDYQTRPQFRAFHHRQERFAFSASPASSPIGAPEKPSPAFTICIAARF